MKVLLEATSDAVADVNGNGCQLLVAEEAQAVVALAPK